ncbi:MAG: response regulator [Dehalococcoidia bacterium]
MKILVVEDDLNLRRIVSLNLRKRDYLVVEASNGRQALTLVADELPDLILLDLAIPSLSGWKVLTAIKRPHHLRKIPVIIMTASAAETERERALGMGAASYLVKPFGVATLMQEVTQQLARRQSDE